MDYPFSFGLGDVEPAYLCSANLFDTFRPRIWQNKKVSRSFEGYPSCHISMFSKQYCRINDRLDSFTSSTQNHTVSGTTRQHVDS